MADKFDSENLVDVLRPEDTYGPIHIQINNFRSMGNHIVRFNDSKICDMYLLQKLKMFGWYDD